MGGGGGEAEAEEVVVEVAVAVAARLDVAPARVPPMVVAAGGVDLDPARVDLLDAVDKGPLGARALHRVLAA
jgi:hypothetical protein